MKLKSKLSVAILLSTLIATPVATAVTFDCSKAHSFAEKQICSDSELSQYDDNLYKTFKVARSATNNSKNFKKFAGENWKKREKCTTKECIKDWYENSFYLYTNIVSQGEDFFTNPSKQNQTQKQTAYNVSKAIVLVSQPDGYDEGSQNNTQNKFISGEKIVVGPYNPSKDIQNQGVHFEYNNAKISMYTDQFVMFLKITKSNGQKIEIPLDYQDIENDQTVYDDEYAIARHDFDGDGVDEIVVATIYKPRGDDSCGNKGFMTVYRFKDNQAWTLQGSGIYQDPVFEIKENKVRLMRAHRNMGWLWTFENNDFQERELP